MTANYTWPATGAAAPTPTQVQNQNTVVVALTPASADTNFPLTHSFGLSTADLSAGWPEVQFVPLDALASGSNWFVASALNPNLVWLGKGNTTASGDTVAQIEVIVRRPHTIGR